MSEKQVSIDCLKQDAFLISYFFFIHLPLWTQLSALLLIIPVFSKFYSNICPITWILNCLEKPLSKQKVTKINKLIETSIHI